MYYVKPLTRGDSPNSAGENAGLATLLMGLKTVIPFFTPD